jgi:hypothetical protein
MSLQLQVVSAERTDLELHVAPARRGVAAEGELEFGLGLPDSFEDEPVELNRPSPGDEVPERAND